MLEYQTKIAAAGFVLAGAIATSISASPVSAATSTATFQVSANVPAICLISANNLAFGAYTGAVTNATSTVSVTCTNATPYTIGLDAGTSTGATVATRKMTGPRGALLAYSLSRDSAHSLNWGN